MLELKKASKQIRVGDEVKRYMVEVIAATRKAEGVQMGASPRASLMLMKAAQALALMNGVEFVTPDHVQGIAVPVVAHRLIMDSQARFSGTTNHGVVEDILKSVPAPA